MIMIVPNINFKILISSIGIVLAMMVSTLSFARDQLCPDKVKNAVLLTKTQNVIAISCKILPNEPEKMVVSYIIEPYENHNTQDLNEIMPDYIWETLLVDSSSYKVLKKAKETIVNDAAVRVSEHSIWIDTAVYQIKPTLRAFGIRLNIGHSPSCADGGSSDYLTLFVEEQKQLRPILKSLPMSYWYIRENYHCGVTDVDTKPMIVERMKSYLKIESTNTNGFNDISVVGVAVRENDQDEQIGKRIIKQKIHYDGQAYSIKPWEKLIYKQWYGVTY